MSFIGKKKKKKKKKLLFEYRVFDVIYIIIVAVVKVDFVDVVTHW
jgi:hypothetical protein